MKRFIIDKVLEQSDVSVMEFSQKRTLYIDSFTLNRPCSVEESEVFCPSNIDEVFSHFSPSLENFPLEKEDGTFIDETFRFGAINDFSDEKIISQSSYLSKLNQQIATYQEIISLLDNQAEMLYLFLNSEEIERLLSSLEITNEEINETIERIKTFGIFGNGSDIIKQDNIKIINNLHVWISLFKEEDKTIKVLKVKYHDILEQLSSILHKNLCNIRGKIRNLETAYYCINFYFRNCSGNVNYLLIKNIDRTELLYNDSKDTFAVKEELELHYDCLSLKRNYSFLVIPGYLGSADAIRMWARIAYKYKVILITDFKDSPNFETLKCEIDNEQLKGNDTYLSNAVVLCNYVKVRKRSILSCESDDLFIPSSVGLAARLTNLDVKISDAVCGKNYGHLRGILETRIKRLHDIMIKYIIHRGFLPVVEIDNNFFVPSKETLGEFKYPITRTIDWLAKGIQNIAESHTFCNPHSIKANLICDFHRFMGANRVPEGFIVSYQLKELLTDMSNNDIKILFSVKLFNNTDFTNEIYDIKITGISSEHGQIVWRTDITR